MRSVFILILLVCMIAPMAAISADKVGVTTVAPSASSVKVYLFDRTDEPQFSESKDWDKEVSLDVKDMTFGEAVKMLLKNTDIKYMVDPQVLPLKVTAVLKNVALRDAMQEIARAAGVTLKTQEGVLRISPRQPYSNLGIELQRQIADMMAELARERVGKTEDNPKVKSLEKAIEELQKRLAEDRGSASLVPNLNTFRWAVPTEPGKPSKTQVFTIQYINPAELVPLLYSLGARQVTVVSGGKLVVNATDEVMAQAAEVIRSLDTEDALPRPVRVRVSVSYVLSNKNGPVKSADASMEGTTAEGQPVRLRTTSQVEFSEVFSQTLLQETDLTPVIGPDDRITLTGGLKISNGVEDRALSAVSESQIAVSTASGKPSVIGSGALMLPGTIGYKLEYEVTATATIGEGRLRVKPGGGFGGGGGSLIAPGLGVYKGMGIFGGDSECFDPTQWSAAFDVYGERMNGFAAAMEAAAAQWQKAFDAFGAGGGFGGYGQDSDRSGCSSGGGGGV